MKRKALPQRKWKIDVAWIGSLRECAGPDAEVFLDRLTGRALVLSERVIEAALSDATEACEILSPDERDDLSLARAIRDDRGDRFVSLPGVSRATRYAWMAEFAGSVAAPDVSARLESALDLEPTIRRFDHVLGGFQMERHLWYRFRRRKLEAETETWLAELGIEPAEGV